MRKAVFFVLKFPIYVRLGTFQAISPNGELEVECGGQLLGELTSQEQCHSKAEALKHMGVPPLSAVSSASVHSIPKSPTTSSGYE